VTFAEYSRWLDSFGERCEHCRLPMVWHDEPQGAYRCIVTGPLFPPEPQYNGKPDPDISF